MGNNLKRLREQRGWTQDEAAGRFGLSRGGYIKIERSERGLSQKHIQKAAKVFGVPAHQVFTGPRTAEVIGHVGAGGIILYDGPLGGEPELIDCPPDAPPETVAVRIRGDSLGSGFDGWLALYARREDPFSDALIGSLCIVGTADGRTLIKWVRRGRLGYNLMSGTGAVEEDVIIRWGARVIDLRPAVSLKS